jgi:hypothetical protein
MNVHSFDWIKVLRLGRRPERGAVALGRPDGVQGCTTTAHKYRYYSRDLSRESEKGLLLFLIGDRRLFGKDTSFLRKRRLPRR